MNTWIGLPVKRSVVENYDMGTLMRCEAVPEDARTVPVSMIRALRVSDITQ